MSAFLSLSGITKRYPGALVLDNAGFEIAECEIHCLVGENGAGKSTLMNILAGITSKDAGSIKLNGVELELPSPLHAQAAGIGMIHQDFKLVPDLTVAQNMFLGNEPINKRTRAIDNDTLTEKAMSVLKELGADDIDPNELIARLGSAKRQMVEIAKALTRPLRVLILDEPTAALTEREKVRLFALMRRLSSSGVGIIYISHRLEEIFEIGDGITVLRDGRTVATRRIGEVDTKELIRLMVGRDLHDIFEHEPVEPGETLLEVTNLCTPFLRDITFSLRRGEVLGVAGLIGSGKIELSRALFGAERITSGTVRLDGNCIKLKNPTDAIDAGIALLTEDRNHLGLALNMNARENMSLSSLKQLLRGPLIDTRREKVIAAQYVEQVMLKPPKSEMPVAHFSGGNRQKVILARWLNTDARLFIFNEPTAGIDVGAKHEIYRHMNRLAMDGRGILCFSSDLMELLGVSDRIAVMCDGRITGILDRSNATQEGIMTLATMFRERHTDVDEKSGRPV